MLLKEYSLKEKTKLVNLINYLQPLVDEDKLDKILDFYKYFDESYFDVENSAIYNEFIESLMKIAEESTIEIPEELN